MSQPTNDKELLLKLDSTLEHASHAWGKFAKERGIEVAVWPPSTDGLKTGTPEYHFAVVIQNVYESYCYARTWYNENI